MKCIYPSHYADYTVEFDFSLGQKGSQWEPPEPASVDIVAVFAGDMDIYPDLSKETIDSIKEFCLEYMTMKIQADKDEASIARWESRSESE